MNYWKQFANMLGLELNENFSLVKPNGEKIYNASYKITEDGLYYKGAETDGWCDEPSATVGELLSGDYKAVPKPWKPTYDEFYWCYSNYWGRTSRLKWANTVCDLLLWKAGNCFRTEEEAKTKGKEIMEQIQKEFEEGD